MDQADIPYERILFVCVNERDPGACCARRGSLDLRERLKAYVKDSGLKGRVRVSRSGCQGYCQQGPNVMVFPDGVWHSAVTDDDVNELCRLYIDPLKDAAASSEPIE